MDLHKSPQNKPIRKYKDLLEEVERCITDYSELVPIIGGDLNVHLNFYDNTNSNASIDQYFKDWMSKQDFIDSTDRHIEFQTITFQTLNHSGKKEFFFLSLKIQ